jgi:hypothetical protein
MRFLVRDACLSASPEGAEPSAVAGVCQAEYDELAENLLWYGRRTVLRALADIDALIRQQRRWEASGFIDPHGT